MTTTPPTPEPDDRPAACTVFDRLVNRVLDGEAPVAELLSDLHPAGCRSCRQVREGAFLLLDGLKRMPPAVPSPGFTDRVTRAAVREYRARRTIRWAARAGAGALAASVVLVWLASPQSPLADRGPFARWWPRPPVLVRPIPAPYPEPVAPRTVPAESIQTQLGEAGSAVVALTRKATDETLAPARNLFAAPAPQVPPMQPALDLPDPLTELPEAAKAGLEPLTNTAKRAVNLFLRDVGGAAGAGKMGS